MKKTNSQSQKEHFNLNIILAAMSAMVILLCFLTVHQSNQMIRSDTSHYLNEISQQSAYKVNEQVYSKLNALEAVAENLALLEGSPSSISHSYLSNEKLRNSFVWIGYTGPDESLQTMENEPWDVSGNPIIKDALAGKPGVSSTLLTDMNGNEGILYAVPFISGNTVCGALAGWTGVGAMNSLLSVETFNGQGFSHIIDQNGNFIVRSDNPNSLLSGENLFKELSERARFLDGGSLEELQTALRQGDNYHLHAMFDDSADEDINYIPLNSGNWYLVAVAPGGVYTGMINSFTRWAVASNVAIFLIFLTLIFVIMILNNKKNRQIENIAYEDPVTGGFTCPRFDMEIANIMKDFKPYAFLSMDIRKFKLINDAFGSKEGNRVLKHTYQTVLRHLNTGEYAARIASDTFNILLLTTDQQEIRDRIEEISTDLNAFNKEQKTPYYLPLVCGIYIVNSPMEDIINIRDRANTARKTNKNAPSSGQRSFSCTFYTDMERLQLLKEKEIENNMEGALAKGEFIVYLQPKVDLNTDKIVGAEALVRWLSPEKGLIPPGDFIPFFEKNGFIRKLDLYMFEKVCRIIKKWIEEGRIPVPVSVNLSRVHLSVPNFLQQFKEIQERYGIPPSLLEIELTETMVFENLALLKEVVDQIHAMGFTCSMDDFGSGYSSLNMLKDVPVDILKLDRVFFDKTGDERGNDVIESVIHLAKKLGMTTISEGVETPPQVEFLRKVNCDMVQGFIFSRPVPVTEFEHMAFASKTS